MPSSAAVQMAQSRMTPKGHGADSSRTEVYVPAMSTKIIAWSSRRVTLGSGDPEAAAFARRFQGRLFGLTYRVLGDRDPAELPEEQVRSLLLTVFRGLTARDISELDGAQLGTVKTRIRAAPGSISTLTA
jgi:hypothetical protein